jgi:hypothetical protein
MSLENWNYAPDGITAANLGPNDYLEDRKTGKEQYSPGTATANRSFIVRWGARSRFLDDLLGYSYLDVSDNVLRVLPAEHPEIENFFAEDATVEGEGVLGATLSDSCDWTIARINVNYKSRDYAVLADNAVSTELERYTSRTFAVAAENLTLQGNMQFVTTCSVLQSPPTKLTMSMECTYVWHEVPANPDQPFIVPNLTAITNCVGRVNSVTFDPTALNAPPGTVLFLGLDPKMVCGKLCADTSPAPLGNYHWEIQMKFLYRNNGQKTASRRCARGISGSVTEYAGHNWVYNVDASLNDWDLITSDGTTTGPRVYTSANLNTLWDIG